MYGVYNTEYVFSFVKIKNQYINECNEWQNVQDGIRYGIFYICAFFKSIQSCQGLRLAVRLKMPVIYVHYLDQRPQLEAWQVWMHKSDAAALCTRHTCNKDNTQSNRRKHAEQQNWE